MCDVGTGPRPVWCSESCELNLTSTNPGASCISCIQTNPGSLGSLALGQEKRLVIGDGVPVFTSANEVAFTSKYDLYVPYSVCIAQSAPYLSGPTSLCSKNTVGSVRAGESVHLSFDNNSILSIRGNTTNMTAPYYDSVLSWVSPTRPGVSQLNFTLGGYTEPLNIRIAKPVVSNVAGGAVFLSDSLGYNSDYIVNGFLNDLKKGNFTTAVISQSNFGADKNLSSSVLQVENVGTNSSFSQKASQERAAIQSLSTQPSPGANQAVHISEEGQFVSRLVPVGDNQNALTLKSGDLIIDSAITLAGIKTIIVENGDLVISGNISNNESSSWAFVVKNGNVLVSHNVTKLAGIYIVNCTEGNTQNCGLISGDGTKTVNQLVVDGSLYGNSSDLVNSHTYVRGESSYEALRVGVIINYSNRALKNPPPLLSYFMGIYNLNRVAK